MEEIKISGFIYKVVDSHEFKFGLCYLDQGEIVYFEHMSSKGIEGYIFEVRSYFSPFVYPPQTLIEVEPGSSIQIKGLRSDASDKLTLEQVALQHCSYPTKSELLEYLTAKQGI